VIDHVPGLGAQAAHLRQRVRDKLVEHREYITRHGDDMPEIKNWSGISREQGRRLQRHGQTLRLLGTTTILGGRESSSCSDTAWRIAALFSPDSAR
jgi:hypothetical protein